MEELADDEEGSDVESELTDVATDGENLCPCPDEEEEVELDLSALEKEIQSAMEDGEDLGSPETQAELAADVLSEEEEPEKETSLDEDEEIELSIEEDDELEEDVLDLLEKITFDYETTPHGHTHLVTNAEVDYAVEIAKAKEAVEALNSEKEENKKLTRRVKGLLEKIEKYEENINNLKEHISQVNISNAKMLYMNRVLSSASLNERQKAKIVEALSKADSIKEAKVIYETLQSSVGTSQKRSPKSLSEAVEKRSSLLLSASRQKEDADNPMQQRWKRLAGIN